MWDFIRPVDEDREHFVAVTPDGGVREYIYFRGGWASRPLPAQEDAHD